MEPKQLEVLQSLQTELINELEVCAEYITQDLDSINKMLDALTKVNELLHPKKPITIQQIQPSQLPQQTQQPKLAQPQSTQQTQKDTNHPEDTKPKFKFADGAVVRGREHLMEANNAKATVKEVEDIWADYTEERHQPDVRNDSGGDGVITVDNHGSPNNSKQPITRQQLQQPYSVPNAKGLTQDNKASDAETLQQPQQELPVIVPDSIPNVELVNQRNNYLLEAQTQAIREIENILGRRLTVEEMDSMVNGNNPIPTQQVTRMPLPQMTTVERLSIYPGQSPLPPMMQAMIDAGFMNGLF